MVSDNLELLWIWALVQYELFEPLFAIHTGIFRASIADTVSVIVANIIYLCQENTATPIRASSFDLSWILQRNLFHENTAGQVLFEESVQLWRSKRG